VKIKCRICIAVQPDGEWNAAGWGFRNNAPEADRTLREMAEGPMRETKCYWIETEVDTPEPSQFIKVTATEDAP